MSCTPRLPSLVIRHLGLVEYAPAFVAMQDFTARRSAETADEVWLLQHPPVYTQGLAGKPEHLLMPGEIPVIQIDRGGQVTYHGPGQIVAYLLIDLRRRGFGVKSLVWRMEQAIIDVLADYGVAAVRRNRAPGVYVGAAKIAALGLRIRNQCSYHGLSLNVDVELSPFLRINPCGYAGLEVTRTCDQGITAPLEELAENLSNKLQYWISTLENNVVYNPENLG